MAGGWEDRREFLETRYSMTGFYDVHSIPVCRVFRSRLPDRCRGSRSRVGIPRRRRRLRRVPAGLPRPPQPPRPSPCSWTCRCAALPAGVVEDARIRSGDYSFISGWKEEREGEKMSGWMDVRLLQCILELQLRKELHTYIYDATREWHVSAG